MTGCDGRAIARIGVHQVCTASVNPPNIVDRFRNPTARRSERTECVRLPVVRVWLPALIIEPRLPCAVSDVDAFGFSTTSGVRPTHGASHRPKSFRRRLRYRLERGSRAMPSSPCMTTILAAHAAIDWLSCVIGDPSGMSSKRAARCRADFLTFNNSRGAHPARRDTAKAEDRLGPSAPTALAAWQLLREVTGRRWADLSCRALCGGSERSNHERSDHQRRGSVPRRTHQHSKGDNRNDQAEKPLLFRPLISLPSRLRSSRYGHISSALPLRSNRTSCARRAVANLATWALLMVHEDTPCRKAGRPDLDRTR